MNMTPAQALLREEWSRVRGWWPVAVAVLFFYALGLDIAEPILRHTSAWGAAQITTWGAAEGLNGFEVWEHAGKMPRELFLIPAVLAAAMIFGVLTAYDDARGLSLGIPGRYLILPQRAARTFLLQAACRLSFALPIAALLAYMAGRLSLRNDISPETWFYGAIVGIAGPLAAAAWWRRLGLLTVFLGILLPVSLWIAGTFDYALVGNTPFALPAAGLALLFLFSGAALLHMGAGFEPSAGFRYFRAFARPSEAGRNTAFPSSAAALRWYGRPRFIVYVIPLTGLISLAITGFVLFNEAPHLFDMNWVPWTPTGVRTLALFQWGLVHWGYYALDVFTWGFGITAGLEGVVFLRTHLLQRPYNLRLPATSWQLARDTALGVFAQIFKASFLCTLLFAGSYYVATMPNVGAQYIWPNGHYGSSGVLDDTSQFRYQSFGVLTTLGVDYSVPTEWRERNYRGAFFEYLLPDNPHLRELAVDAEGFLTHFLVSFLIGCAAFWQVMWLVVPIWWSTGLESAFLVAVAAAVAVHGFQTRRRSWAVLGILAAIALTTNYSLWLANQHAPSEEWFASIAPLCLLVLLGGLAANLWLGKGWRRPTQIFLAFALLLTVCVGVGSFLSLEIDHRANFSPLLISLRDLYSGLDAPAREFVCFFALLLMPTLSLWGLTVLRRHT